MFDIAGRMVAEMSVDKSVGDAYMRPVGGMYAAPTNETVIWRPSENICSGVYLVRAKIGDNNITKRIVYLK